MKPIQPDIKELWRQELRLRSFKERNWSGDSGWFALGIVMAGAGLAFIIVAIGLIIMA